MVATKTWKTFGYQTNNAEWSFAQKLFFSLKTSFQQYEYFKIDNECFAARTYQYPHYLCVTSIKKQSFIIQAPLCAVLWNYFASNSFDIWRKRVKWRIFLIFFEGLYLKIAPIKHRNIFNNGIWEDLRQEPSLNINWKTGLISVLFPYQMERKLFVLAYVKTLELQNNRNWFKKLIAYHFFIFWSNIHGFEMIAVATEWFEKQKTNTVVVFRD